MTERPIIMRAESVRAILAGAKTQTRRIVKPQPPRCVGDWFDLGGVFKPVVCLPGWDGVLGSPSHREALAEIDAFDNECIRCPYGIAGDRLWVREAWAARLDQDHFAPRDLPRGTVGYWADGPGRCCRTGCAGGAGKVRSPIHMPRWASRLTLEVTGVRVERLQEISREDAIEEGAFWVDDAVKQRSARLAIRDGHAEVGPIDYFREFWKGTHGADSWDENPWVWVIEFRRVAERDAAEARA